MEFEFQTDRNHYVDLRQTYLALKLKLVTGRNYQSYYSKELNKEHKEEAKADEETEEDEDVPVRLNNNLRSIFFQIWSVHQQSTSLQIKWTVCAQIFLSNNFKGAISDYKGVLHCEGYDYEEFPDEIMQALLSELFFTKKMKVLSRPDGFMLYGKMGAGFFYTSQSI